MSALPQSKIVYLDYAATTPVDRHVAEVMAQCLLREDGFGNPSSTHALGAMAKIEVEKARAQVAALIRCDAQEIVWTGSATEANNLAILGVARHALRGRRATRMDAAPLHIVTSRIEHKSVINPCKQLEKEGFKVTWLKPDTSGRISAAQVAEALRAETVLVSLMSVNNELGSVNDIAEIGKICRTRGVPLHVDAVQAAGKIAIDVRAQNVDLLSLSAHKIYGPKGVGALYVRSTPPLGIEPLVFGGGQEGGLRSGTLATHQIVGMGLACEIANDKREAETKRIAALRERLLAKLKTLGGVQVNSPTENAPPHIINVSFQGVHGESLLKGLEDLAVSSGSTCNSATAEPSYVLRALGKSDALAEASLRFSLGRFTTEEEIDFATAAVKRKVTQLRALSPALSASLDAQKFSAGEAGSIEQGTWVRVLLRSEGERILDVRIQVYGCPHTMAACEWLEEHLKGRNKREPLPEGIKGMAAAVSAPVEKYGRLLIIEDALKNAL